MKLLIEQQELDYWCGLEFVPSDGGLLLRKQYRNSALTCGRLEVCVFKLGTRVSGNRLTRPAEAVHRQYSLSKRAAVRRHWDECPL